MEPQKPGNYPGCGRKVETESRHRASGSMSILPILVRHELNGRMCPLQRRQERTQRGRTSFSVETERICVSKNLDETVRLQSAR